MKEFKNRYVKILVLSMILLFHFSGSGISQELGKNYALLLGGAGWSEEYTSKYMKFLLETKKA
ncbi:hypothetical protein ACFL7D_10590, partial [candidate division KSB1 bacterium]